jgi:hypothetical protein
VSDMRKKAGVDMPVVILAGGLGTRLREETVVRPFWVGVFPGLDRQRLDYIVAETSRAAVGSMPVARAGS